MQKAIHGITVAHFLETYRDKLRGDGIAISQVRATSRYLATVYDQGRPVKQRVAHRL